LIESQKKQNSFKNAYQLTFIMPPCFYSSYKLAMNTLPWNQKQFTNSFSAKYVES